jgi:hypothetical protein
VRGTVLESVRPSDEWSAESRKTGFRSALKRGFLGFTLGDTAGQARATGNPETILATIEENLAHDLSMSDAEGES